MGREKVSFRALLTQPPLVIVCHAVNNGYPFTALRPQEELRDLSLWTLVDKISHILRESVAVTVVAQR